MSLASTDDVLVSLALRLKSFAEPDAIAEVFGTDPAVVETILQNLAASGFANHREGRVSGWSLTPDGRAHGEQLLAAELDGAELRPAVTECYRQFLALNAGFLQLCTRWQVVDVDAGVLNDHTDPEYDRAVIADLAVTDGVIQPICAGLGESLARFRTLGPRFASALDHVQAGQIDFFTKPLIDSYHTVWFDLHESLLATLGIDRASEQA